LKEVLEIWDTESDAEEGDEEAEENAESAVPTLEENGNDGWR
jgi:hypothetical protein